MEILRGIPTSSILLALASGLVPGLIWLWFWLREDRNKPEPLGLIILTFFIGMGAVIAVIPAQAFVERFIIDPKVLTITWAGIEEVAKYLGAAVIAFGSLYNDEPVDMAIYLIAAGLGFASLENALYLIDPISLKDAEVSLMTGNLRFLGSTLLHSVSSGVIGIVGGLAFFAHKKIRVFAIIIGLIGATALHSAFNFLIVEEGRSFIQALAFLWIVTVIVMLLFEKLRRMGDYETVPA